MNEIKFRAWDKQSKRMRAVNTITFHYEGGSFDYNNSRLPKAANLWGKDIIDDKDIIIHRDIKQVEIMQYIGLKDINDVDIYEGDILKATCRKKVGYEEVALGFKLPEYKDNQTQYWTVEHKIFNGYMGYIVYGIDRRWNKMISKNMIQNCKCVVVGNIYENKELLEESKQ